MKPLLLWLVWNPSEFCYLFHVKNRMTSNLPCVYDQVCNKILNAEFKGDKYFIDEVETQLREKTLWGSQT